MSALKPGLGPTSDAEARRPKLITPELRKQALGAIEQLMVAGVSQNKIEDVCKEKFGLTRGKVKEYAKVVRQRWADEEREARPTYKQQAMRRIMGHINSAAKDGNFAAVAQFERLLSEMQGTKEAADVNINLNVATSQAMLHVVSSLSAEQRAAIIKLQRDRLGAEGVKALVEAAKPQQNVIEAAGEAAELGRRGGAPTRYRARKGPIPKYFRGADIFRLATNLGRVHWLTGWRCGQPGRGPRSGAEGERTWLPRARLRRSVWRTPPSGSRLRPWVPAGGGSPRR